VIDGAATESVAVALASPGGAVAFTRFKIPTAENPRMTVIRTAGRSHARREVAASGARAPVRPPLEDDRCVVAASLNASGSSVARALTRTPTGGGV
jgi:hypothetical protein